MTEGPVTAVTLDIPAAFIADPVLFIVMGRLCISFFFAVLIHPLKWTCVNPTLLKTYRHPSQTFQRTQGDFSPLPLIRGRVRGVTGDYERWL